MFLPSLIRAYLRHPRFFIRVIRVIRGVRREKVWSFRGCNPHPVAGRNSRSHRLAWRLCDEFCGEGVLGELAAGLRAQELDVRWGAETILRSELFFSPANIGSRVCDPVSFLVGPLR